MLILVNYNIIKNELKFIYFLFYDKQNKPSKVLIQLSGVKKTFWL